MSEVIFTAMKHFLKVTPTVEGYETLRSLKDTVRFSNKTQLGHLVREAYALGKDGEYPFRSPICIRFNKGPESTENEFENGVRVHDGSLRLAALWLAGYEGQVKFVRYQHMMRGHNIDLMRPYVIVHVKDFSPYQVSDINRRITSRPIFVKRGQEYAHLNDAITYGKTDKIIFPVDRKFSDSFSETYSEKLVSIIKRKLDRDVATSYAVSDVEVILADPQENPAKILGFEA